MSRNGFRGIKKYSATIGKLTADNVRRVVTKAFETLIRTSPVDTGRFQPNWMGSVGSPDTRTNEETHKVTTGSAPTGAEIAHLAPALRIRLGQHIYISNNLDYAQALENGHSKQAPLGVLHKSAREVESRLRR
jgi:hypothetical protein